MDQPCSCPPEKIKEYSVIMVYSNDHEQLLLQKKLRGPKFNIGKWNGVGGSVEEGENPDAGAIREVEEETGITEVQYQSFKKFGIQDFYNMGPFQDKPVRLHLYEVILKPNINFTQKEDEELRWFDAATLRDHEFDIAGLGNVTHWNDLLIHDWGMYNEK
jgi:8-oxo-dGTP diphosphatase